MAGFEIVPAVPVAYGRVVGDVGGIGRNPLAVAWHWMAAGARRVHFEELSAPDTGRGPATLPALVLGCRQGPARIQVGGGIRESRVARLLRAQGADTLVFHRSLTDPDLLDEMLAAVRPEKVMVAVNLEELDDRKILAGLSRAWAQGVRRVLLVGPWMAPTVFPYQEAAINRFLDEHWEVWAAGHLQHQKTIARLKELGVSGVMIGQALYQGRLSFKDLMALREPPAAS